MATFEKLAAINDSLYEAVTTPGMEKVATDALTEYTRIKIREEGFLRKILPPITVTKDDFDRQIDSPRPVIIFDKQPESGPAIEVPLNTLTSNVYLKGSRYALSFSRIMTQKFQSDVADLYTHYVDIRQQVSDQSMRDVEAAEDTKLIAACNVVMIGADALVPANGNVKQWETIYGGITRETWQDAKKIMRRGIGKLSASVALLNHITALELQKLYPAEIGEAMSEDMLKNGLKEIEFGELKLLVTNKTAIVPDNAMYMFAGPEYFGKHCVIEDITMFLKKEYFMIEFFAAQYSGATIGNGAAVTRVDFA